MATALPSFLDSMKCPICLDFAQNAVETVCCVQVYCETCVKDLEGKNCPSCRHPDLETCVSRSVRKLIGEIPVECPNSCGEAVTKSSARSHRESCPQREHTCPIENCDFSGLLQAMVDHAALKHPKEVLSSLNKAFQPEVNSNDVEKRKSFHCPFDQCQDKEGMGRQTLLVHLTDFHAGERNDFYIEKKAFLCPFRECNIGRIDLLTEFSKNALIDHIYRTHDQDWCMNKFNPKHGPITVVNSEGSKASMAVNGKFYCSREDGADADVDGDEDAIQQVPCTYESKLNCRACMKLDVVLRNLPYGKLVNGAGHVARPSLCDHDVVKGSEYFASNSRNVYCRYTTCGDSPEFTCNMPNTGRFNNPPCSFQEQCEDCERIAWVYAVHFKHRDNDTLKDKDYYGYVWNKP